MNAPDTQTTASLPVPACVVSCVAYSRDGSRRDLNLDQISDVLGVDDGAFVWVGLFNPDHTLLDKLQEEFDLHDLAVAPQAAGQGLAQRLVSHLWARAAEERLSHSALVSVQGSQPFWERLGYRVQALDDPAQQRHLDSYGPGACYMAQPLR